MPDPVTSDSRSTARALGITLAQSVAPSDTSTSTLIHPDGIQIRYGRTETVTHNDILYSTPLSAVGHPTELKLDILAPATGTRRALVVCAPGGGFVVAAKESGQRQRIHLAEHGYVVASIEHRTILHGATYREGVADVKAAIRHLRAHADQYGIDPARVAVHGESAGGYLAAMVGVSNGRKQFDIGDHLEHSSDVQAVVDLFGPSDLSQVGADFDDAARLAHTAAGNPFASWVLGPGTDQSLADHPDEVARADPATYADPSAPPFLLLHGSADLLVSPSQTLLLHNALRVRGADSTRYVVADANHGDMTFLGDPDAGLPWTTTNVTDCVLAFLDKHLGA